MTPERTKELLPMMQAYASGKKLECRRKGTKAWVKPTTVTWQDDFDYRIAQDKLKGWVNIYHVEAIKGYASGGPFISKEEADRHAGCNRVACVEIAFEDLT